MNTLRAVLFGASQSTWKVQICLAEANQGLEKSKSVWRTPPNPLKVINPLGALQPRPWKA